MKVERKKINPIDLVIGVIVFSIFLTVFFPKYKYFEAKSKTSEAKLILARVYASEIAYKGEWGMFVSCMPSLEVHPFAKGYYVFGFTEDAYSANERAREQGALCENGKYAMRPFELIGQTGVTATYGDILLSSISYDGESFSSGAAGRISDDREKVDLWHIDETKVINNTIRGY